MATPYESQLEHIRQAALIDGYAHATFWENWTQVVNFVLRTKPDLSPDMQLYTAEKKFFEKNWNEPFWGQDPSSTYVRQARKMWFKVLEEGISRRRWDEVWSECKEIRFGIGLSREADQYLAERWVWRKLWPHYDQFPGQDPRITLPDGPVAIPRKSKLEGERDGHGSKHRYSRRHSDKPSPLPRHNLDIERQLFSQSRRSRSPESRRVLRLDKSDYYRPPPSMKREPSADHIPHPSLRRQDASLSSAFPITPQKQPQDECVKRREKSPLPPHIPADPCALQSLTPSQTLDTCILSNVIIPNTLASRTLPKPKAQSPTNSETLVALKKRAMASRSSRATMPATPTPQLRVLNQKIEREMEDEDSEDMVDTVEFILERKVGKKRRF